MRVAEQERAGAAGERLLDRGQVEASRSSASGSRVDRHQLAAGHRDDVAERRVARHRHHDRARRAEHLERQPDPAHHAAGRAPTPRPGTCQPQCRSAKPANAAPSRRRRTAGSPARRDVRRRPAPPRSARPRGSPSRRPRRGRPRLDGAPLEGQGGAGLVVGEVADHAARNLPSWAHVGRRFASGRVTRYRAAAVLALGGCCCAPARRTRTPTPPSRRRPPRSRCRRRRRRRPTPPWVTEERPDAPGRWCWSTNPRRPPIEMPEVIARWVMDGTITDWCRPRAAGRAVARRRAQPGRGTCR